MFLAMNDNELTMIVVVLSVGGFIAVTAIVVGAIRTLFETRTRDRSRQEVAAYVAEGSISAEEAERILKAEPKSVRKGAS